MPVVPPDRRGQRAPERRDGGSAAPLRQKWSKEEFIAHFGKNYLDEAELWGIEHPDDSWDNESAFHLIEEGAVLPF